MWAVLLFVYVYSLFVLGYSLLVGAVYLSQLLISIVVVTGRRRAASFAGLDDLFDSPLTPAISIIVPAYNESANIVQSVRSLLNLRYPRYEVVVCNDGSKDDTLAILVREFAMRRLDAVFPQPIPTAPVRGVYVSTIEPNLTVVDKVNGGRSDALNGAMNHARCPLYCCVDADSILVPDALLKVVRPFVERPELTVAVGGTIGIANGVRIERGSVIEIGMPRNPLARFQIIEYMRAFIGGRTAWSHLNSLMIVSGAFGLFRRELAVELGGYRTDTVGEDAELTTHIHQYMRERGRKYRIEFVEDTCCWTEAPETLKILKSQRRRWHRGCYEFLAMHRGLLNPRYGTPAWLGYPYFFIVELMGPVVEASGYFVLAVSIAFGLINLRYALLLGLVALCFGVLVTLGTLILDEFSFAHYARWRDILTLFLFSLLENLGYRQLTVIWRLQGLWDLARGTKGWGVMERKGLGA
jgi:cellulose synthase/poly-beta-1,6-N-acetylglucosamine synthase-like glycosyltransferase